MSKGPVCCLGVYILLLSLQPEGLVTPIHLPQVNVFDRLEVLEMYEMSSPNKTTQLVGPDESSQVPDGRGSGSARLLKQPLSQRAIKLQVLFFWLFRLLSKVDFPSGPVQWKLPASAAVPGAATAPAPPLKSRWHRPVPPPGSQIGLKPEENG